MKRVRSNITLALVAALAPLAASCGGDPSASATGGAGGDAAQCKNASDPQRCVGTTQTSSSSGAAGAGGSSSATGGGDSGIGPSGGELDTLSFAIVGDTRPAVEDDTSAYPTAVISKIWQDVDAQSPRPAFAVSTGDYQFSRPYGHEAEKQLALYLTARSAFKNEVFPALGNHECTGATASNCGQGNADGITNNYTAYVQHLLAPLGQTKPYYAINIHAKSGAWTSKLVFVAPNAWDAAQAAWLDKTLATPTTYTFVIRHESSATTEAPGIAPSNAIIAKHPSTLLIAGHTHTFYYLSRSHEVIVGNGGAPLTGRINYGYVIARQRADGAIELKEYDYATNAAQTTFAVTPDGAPAP